MKNIETLVSKDRSSYLIWGGGFILLMASVFSMGYHHFDEHFQVLEFAGVKLGLTKESNLPWEFHNQMRPSIQPWIAIVVFKVLKLFGIGSPFYTSFVLRLFSAVLSFIVLRQVFIKYKESITNKWLLLGFTFFCWFIVYNGVRFSSENWSGIFVLLGYLSYLNRKKESNFSFFQIGIFLGLSFLFRYQVGFMIFGFVLWLIIIGKEKALNLAFLLFGIIVIAFLGVLLDSLFYGEFSVTAWNYLNQNIFMNKVSGFGVAPWYYYFKELIPRSIPPVSLLLMFCFLMVLWFKPKELYVWVTIPFLLIHMLIGHKEFRFIFPLILFVPIFVFEGLLIAKQRFVKLNNKLIKILVGLAVALNFIFTFVVSIKPADSLLPAYKQIYYSYPEGGTLYYFEKNPYVRVIDIHFYKRRNLVLKQISSVNDLPKKGKYLVAFTNKEKKELSINNKTLIYSTFPEWVLKIKFNDWQKRTKSWFIYEVVNED